MRTLVSGIDMPFAGVFGFVEYLLNIEKYLVIFEY